MILRIRRLSTQFAGLDTRRAQQVREANDDVKLFNIFRRSLFLKVFTLSSIISIALIYFLGSNPYVRISNGILDEKIAASLSEAESAIQYADFTFK